MTYALAAALILTITGFVWLLDRRDQRHTRQIGDLCQRIQAPEVAVHQHAAATAQPDELYPMTDDELADPDTAEALERIERMANSEAPWLS